MIDIILKLITLFLYCSFISFSSAYDYLDPRADYFTISSEVDSEVHINVPIVFDNNTYRKWNSIGYYIENTNYKIYVLNWRGYGGDVEIGKDFISDLEYAERHGKIIILNLVGDSYSMHANVACYVNKIEYNNSYLMFHGDADDNDKRVPRYESSITGILNQCVNSGILTQKDVEILWQGNEVYVNKYSTWYKKDNRKIE